ncbi:MAG: cytochrome P450 [Acidimicrobiia bacterium]|nr:cytochrome P450 [Acidimicrobiia bacterium]
MPVDQPAYPGRCSTVGRVGTLALVEFNPFSIEFYDDPYDMYRWLRDEAPAYFNREYGFWALSRFADVVAAHRDWKTFSNEHGLTIDQLTDPSNPMKKSSIIMMDPPDHDRMRKLVSRVFTPRAIGALEPMVRDVITAHLAPLEGEREFDLVADFSAPFPVEIISQILGVPKDDRQQIRHWTDAMLHREADNPATTQAGMKAGLNQTLYFMELAKERRDHPADDMITRLTEVEVEDDDGKLNKLTDAEIAGFGVLIAAAGSETVTKQVGNGVVLFARNPGEWKKVRDDRSKMVNAVEEVLRYWAPSQYQGRFSHEASTWHGVEIPAGMPVLLLTGAANRDEREYKDPDTFDVDRDISLGIGLGHGIHACLGAAVARLESRVAFEEIANRWPEYEIDEAGLQRVHMSNVAGFSNVPVAVAA